ncbi:hypothetical protein BBC27_09635 [Acidithiobacillus ferrivorans]|uniref:Uncharacterized protein n=1 Tax=Acidithiobacillus ferrivorans TaxID=160808 RepID=A0A1B9BZK6_9PROT|nr:hypothetical protein [Acidithiobacillus ferrivorans]OCB03100.1 hypothetical protein BBC27_09635 [Acidithiobacillus ferrivorans]
MSNNSSSKDYINDPDFIADLAVAQLSFMVANIVAVVSATVVDHHGHESVEVQRMHYDQGVRRIVRNMVAEMSVLAGDDAAMDRLVAMGHKIAEERALADEVAGGGQ